MVKWYLATYQNGVFSNDLGIIQSNEDNVYKLKDGIQSTESPEKKDWLRITNNKVEEWVTDNGNSDWNENTSLTGLVNNSTYWVYGFIVKYIIVTDDQTYYLETFSNNENGDTRTITGKDINNSDVTINDVTTITAVTIGHSVTEIGTYAFFQCSSLASLTIPDSVNTIGVSAFHLCNSLVYVNIPDSVEIINNSAFAYCSSLTSLIIPNSVTSIGDNAFYGCSSLASLTIGNSVETIGKDAFAECSSLASLTIGNSVTSIGNAAFYRCENLASLNIPDSVTSIGSYAFYDIGIKIVHYTYITISQSTARRLTNNSTYTSGNTYPEETFFSGSTYVNIIVT